MVDINVRRGSSKKSTGVKPGSYRSTVTSVAWAPGYVTGKAFEIKYALTDKNGGSHTFTELFFNTLKNVRTREFFDYLDGLGISDLADFVGVQEDLILAKDTDGFKTYVRISQRAPADDPNGGGSDVGIPG